jgi:hypothetical protein
MNHEDSLANIPEIDYQREFDGKDIDIYLEETLMRMN